MYIGVNGIQLYYEKTGHGRPLIMVHGNSEDHTIFKEAVEVLKEHFTCSDPLSRSSRFGDDHASVNSAVE